MVKQDKTMMRIDRQLLNEIKKRKLVDAESYQNVIKRMIEKDIDADIDKKRMSALKKNVNRRKGGSATARDIELMMGY